MNLPNSGTASKPLLKLMPVCSGSKRSPAAFIEFHLSAILGALLESSGTNFSEQVGGRYERLGSRLLLADDKISTVSSAYLQNHGDGGFEGFGTSLEAVGEGRTVAQ